MLFLPPYLFSLYSQQLYSNLKILPEEQKKLREKFKRFIGETGELEKLWAGLGFEGARVQEMCLMQVRAQERGDGDLDGRRRGLRRWRL